LQISTRLDKRALRLEDTETNDEGTAAILDAGLEKQAVPPMSRSLMTHWKNHGRNIF
jgi:hypothetical protein